MRTSRSSASAIALLILSTLASTSTAQSQPTDDVCLIDIGPNASIGNVSFDTVVADKPLFWIATVKHDNDRIMTRQFHLFTEDRGLRIGSNTSDFNGCGLALSGVMKTDRKAMLPEVDGEGDPGCDNILGQECAAAVLERARQELDDVLGNATDDAAQQVCGEVRDRLFASSRPEGCDVNVWASISDMGEQCFLGIFEAQYTDAVTQSSPDQKQMSSTRHMWPEKQRTAEMEHK
jgi:hypothetical protein